MSGPIWSVSTWMCSSGSVLVWCGCAIGRGVVWAGGHGLWGATRRHTESLNAVIVTMSVLFVVCDNDLSSWCMIYMRFGLSIGMKASILNIFAEFDGAPSEYGDTWLHPIILRLDDMKREYGDAMREALQEAITETKHRMACTFGIRFLSELPDSAPFLADLAIKHSDDWYRSAAVGALRHMGARDVLRGIYDEVPAAGRDRIGRALATMDAAALGYYGPLTSLLVRGRHPGEYWDEAKAKTGGRALETVALVRDHPQLPESVRQAAQGVYLELQHDR